MPASSPGCGRPAASSPAPTATSTRTTTPGRRPRATPPSRWGQVVVLKGARTVDRRARTGGRPGAPFENPALATGGTGDVLAGTIGALLAQGLEPYDAARLGVYLHGAAGDVLRDRLGDAGLLASDLPIEIDPRPQAAGRRRPSGAAARARLGVRRRGPRRPVVRRPS